MWWVQPTIARVVDSQGQGEPTTFGGSNPPPF